MPDFPDWFFDLKTAALASGVYTYEAVMDFTPKGWRSLWEVGCTAKHAVALDIQCFGIKHI